jgi:hypothetical protein
MQRGLAGFVMSRMASDYLNNVVVQRIATGVASLAVVAYLQRSFEDCVINQRRRS